MASALPHRHPLHPEQNQLIGQLPQPDRLRLLAVCEPVQLVPGEILCVAGQVTDEVFLPVDACISLSAMTDTHPGLEVGMVGREGMLGAPLSLGVAAAPWRAMVQGPGAAWRICTSSFLVELGRSPALQRSLQRYLYVRLLQIATAATCLRYHLIGPRLARWLLMCQDRAHADHFHTTHESLAVMLGVRRVGITVAAGVLQRRGLITYQRGEIQVLDRAGLEVVACSCYAADCQAYIRHMK